MAEYFRLDATAARVVLESVPDAVSGWRSVAARHGLTPSEIVVMEPAFAGLAEV